MGVTNPGGLCHAGASHSPVSFFTMSISCTRDKISIKICSHLRTLLCSVTKSRSSPMNPPMPPLASRSCSGASSAPSCEHPLPISPGTYFNHVL